MKVKSPLEYKKSLKENFRLKKLNDVTTKKKMTESFDDLDIVINPKTIVWYNTIRGGDFD